MALVFYFIGASGHECVHPEGLYERWRGRPVFCCFLATGRSIEELLEKRTP